MRPVPLTSTGSYFSYSVVRGQVSVLPAGSLGHDFDSCLESAEEPGFPGENHDDFVDELPPKDAALLSDAIPAGFRKLLAMVA